MNLTPVLILLGVTALLPCVPALSCHRGVIEAVRNASELPLEWKTGVKTCEVGEGCQDLVMLLENGPLINLVIIKDCVKAEDQEPRVSWLRTGPGLSIVSYTRVCRHSDFCNDVSSTEVLGDLPSPTVPGTLRCPLCLSKDGCEDTPQQVCPAGSSHCYNGVLRLREADVTTNLRVQGCMPQPDCNLLNGTKAIGTLDLRENCELPLGPQALDCNSVALDTVRNVSDLHLRWTTGWSTCEAGQGCQETLILIQNGQELHMVLTKGCTSDADREPRITRQRTGPGISITTYVHVCRHRDFCNDLSTTRNLWTPPPDTGPGTLSCPHCLSTRGCENPPQQVCPEGSSHCYNGVLRFRGEDIAVNLRVQGCMPQSGCNLLDGTKAIGPILVRENCSPQSGAQPLECRSGQTEALRKVSSLPLDWTTGWQTCKIGEGCQETVLLLLNGPDLHLVLSKGCTANEDHKPRVTRHRTGPGLSIISYTHVCRHWDFCNDLSSTHALGVPPPATGPGNLSCPLCLSKDGCPQNAPEQVCPAGSTHCYRGLLSIRGRGLTSELKVQGCMSQPGCNLLNGTQTIGPIGVHEDCNFQLAAEALKCQHGYLEITRDVSQLPLQWTAGQTTCDVGEGCQDTLMMIENGEQVYLALTKGCTSTEDQEAKVTEHRTGPGLSVTSYTRVCRRGDLCNDLSTTAPLWAPPPATALGTLRCPLCFSKDDCENPPQQVCPAGSTHCYKGVLRLRGGEITSNLKVQGCMPQPGCNLLNGTQKIGPVDVREDCSPRISERDVGKNTMTCYKGAMLRLGIGFAKEAVEWSVSATQVCEPEEICQETLLLVDVGPRTLLIGSKGCTGPRAQDKGGISIFSSPPGMLVASYSRFCSSNLCNEASDSNVLLSRLPRPTVPPPGELQCPVCVEFFGSCSRSSSSVSCPQGTSHCYKGDIVLQGGGVSSTVSLQGCMLSPAKTLLGDSKTIGIFSVKELSEGTKGGYDGYDENPLGGGASASPLTGLLGLGLCLALCLTGFVLSAEPIPL
ncbi:CD177 antigen [Mesocricetus auratus]|uniref:CD177 antigen n=1 Tax=Mesocricetus auratus TaxID=10036 RepID=A0ABM2WHI0_MESAU|nr:CD177 antigen [Mesocricetus auratus]